MGQNKTAGEAVTTSNAFSVMASWQFMSFGLLLAFVWANEVLDFPHRVFGTPPAAFNLYRACLMSAAIVATGIVAVGQTYEKQRGIVAKLLKTCLYCHRVKTEAGDWEHVEEYFIRQFPVAMDREPCPECGQMLESVDAKVEAASKGPQDKSDQ